MKVTFLCVENNVSALGFRRIAALARSIHDDVEVCYVVPVRAAAPVRRLVGNRDAELLGEDVDAVATHAARSDMVCLSSMSSHAARTKELIRAIRRKNPRAYVVWGGVHCIVDPEDAIQHADAVCTGEGERAFAELLRAFRDGVDHTHVRNFWFATKDGVLRNALLPLQTPEEMETRPFPLFAEGERIYRRGRGFVPIRPIDFVRFEGLAYNALWSIGCPNRCVYCANSRFLQNHRDYARLRHPTVRYIVEEVKRARGRLPHLSSVTFHDDSFIAMPLPVLEEFSETWRREVGMPFGVHGLVPRFVTAEKLELLIGAGMMRVRMGIQSGSARTLRFYRRPDSLEAIRRAAQAIGAYSKYMVTPSYDLIVDNPVEDLTDTAATLQLLRELPRPYILNVFPLMVIPGTELATVAKKRSLELPTISPRAPSPSLSNLLVMAMALVRIPRRWSDPILSRPQDRRASKVARASAGRALWAMTVARRGLAHLRRGNVSVVPGTFAWVLWRIGLVSLLNRRILRRCASVRGPAPRERAAAAAAPPLVGR
jgi:radical SAM superfamily enzyme YgiQ (UPF0313 family)